MLYAKVVFNLAVRGPFDYIVSPALYKKIKVGVRVWVSLRRQRILGYVVGLSRKTQINELKTITELIDDYAILDKNMLSLTKELADYYCCSWGEAIATALPEGLKKGKRLPIPKPKISRLQAGDDGSTNTILIHDLDGNKRWDIYLEELGETLAEHKSAVILLPDIDSVLKAQDLCRLKLGCPIGVLYRKKPDELEEWVKIKEGMVNAVIGSRSSIFAPLRNLGLIIIEREDDPVYKQDQVPHYHARDIAFMRAKIENVKLILGSTAPSLESFYLAKKHRIQYRLIPRSTVYPQVKILDTKALFPAARRDRSLFLKYLTDLISSHLSSNSKVLIFLNRRGFATNATCRNCRTVLKCARCNINLVYYFRDKLLKCHYCNFNMQPPEICPNCNSGYIRYSGAGTERIENELNRLFPQARIKRLDNLKDVNISDADIFVSTSAITKLSGLNFDLIGILSIDNSFNRIDFRAAEKTFNLLFHLSALTQKQMIIQTNFSKHHSLEALIKADANIFYDVELRQRKEIMFPPSRHLCLVKLRGKKEEKVSELSNELFNVLTKHNKDKNIDIVSVNPAIPSKLRGNFYWQILIKATNPFKLTKFLKNKLQDFSHSGIIVTVDMDPL